MARGRKPIPNELKKQKLTLTCKKENIEFLNTYCYTCGISISELLDSYAAEIRERLERERIQKEQAEAKAERAAKRAAKKAAKEAEDEQLPGQMNISDLPQVDASGDIEKMEQQLHALQELVKNPDLPDKDFEIHTTAIRELKRAIITAKEDEKSQTLQ